MAFPRSPQTGTSPASRTEDGADRRDLTPSESQVQPADLRGLTREEVRDRRARGLGNTAPPATTRSYLQIVRQNAFTFINTVLYATSIALIAMGLWGDALVTAGLVILNVTIAVIQEARAKRTLDRITLLTRPRVTVIRDGAEGPVDASELVVDDLVAVRSGDQIVTDGVLVSRGRIDVDESLLTGESEPVTKRPGDPVYSGSFCVSGNGAYKTEKVGAESQANRMTAGARAFRQEKTPLQREVDFIIRIMVLVVVMVGGPVVIDLAVRVLDVAARVVNEPLSSALNNAYGGYPTRDAVRAAAVVVAIVPQGLALMIVVTYAAAALRLVGKGALVQQANSIESLSHVDVLCLDKTGTLTTNELVFVEAHPVGVGQAELGRLIGDAIAGASDRNRSAEAIAAAFPGERRPIAGEVPFSSDRKWSAVEIDDGERSGVYVLGGPDVLAPALPPNPEVDRVVAEWSSQGRRVLLFASAGAGTHLRDEAGEPPLPERLVPLGLIALVDRLRPEAESTLRRFASLGIQPKIISGDDPRTVAALATQAGFPGEIRLVSGSELEGVDDEAFARLARDGTIFGRTTPQQKERLVQSLRDQGRYVAMIGDGVNDVLSMKRANVAIAVRSGSPATRGVADLILLKDSFAALPSAFAEGQRILGGMRDVIGLFLIRSISVTAVIIGAILAEAPFPLRPKHNSLLAFFAIGVPTLALAALARPDRSGERLLRRVGPLVLTASLTIAPVALTVYLSWWRVTDDIQASRTALTATLLGCSLLIILFVRPPTRFWAVGEEFVSDYRPAVVAAAMMAGFLAVLFIQPLRRAFELSRLSAGELFALALVVVAWMLLMRHARRARWFERLFGIGAS